MDKVKIGVAGMGNMGSVHAKNIFDKKINNMELTAVCDIEPSKINWVNENLSGTVFFKDYREMIDSGLIDSILIASPHYMHPEIAVYAFEKGLHVLTEKPAGVFTKQVEEMNRAAENSGKVYSIMFNQRTNPLFARARQIVQGGELGGLKRFIWIITNWYRTQAYYDSGSWRATWAGEGGGVLINQCPHNLDLWQWIAGMPKKITGFCYEGKYHNIEVEDDVTAYAEYENGATAVFITTTGEAPGTNRLEITGDKGKLVIEDGKLKLWKSVKSEREFCFESTQGFAMPDIEYTEETYHNDGSGHNGILQNFANAILSGDALLAPGYEGINELTLSNAIYLSSWTDSKITLPIDKELFFEKLKAKISKSIPKTDIVPEINDVQGTYNTRWDVRW